MTFDRAAYDLSRYYTRRAWAIEVLGGACVGCGSTELLQFDHVDPATKTYEVSTILLHGDAKVLAELGKCQLRCVDCHRLRTSRQQGVGHGGGVSGKRNCSCIPCKARKAEYMRAYKARTKGISR